MAFISETIFDHALITRSAVPSIMRRNRNASVALAQYMGQASSYHSYGAHTDPLFQRKAALHLTAERMGTYVSRFYTAVGRSRQRVLKWLSAHALGADQLGSQPIWLEAGRWHGTQAISTHRSQMEILQNRIISLLDEAAIGKW